MIKKICVYAASSTEIDPIYFGAAEELGRIMGRKGIELINGAGKMGLMNACTNACMKEGGSTTGVIPQFMIDMKWQHTGMTRLIVTQDMHTRKQTMAQLSDAAIALPGGCGTLEELLEVITWKQLGLYPKPIIILNIDGYYTPLIEMFNKAADQHFMRHTNLKLWKVATTPQQAIDLILNTTDGDYTHPTKHND